MTPSTTSSPASADEPPDAALAALAQRLGHPFADAGLLRRALAHRSWCSERAGEASNERLEFLGDAVLGLAVAELAFRAHPEAAEGRLTESRKAVVNASALAEVAAALGIGDALLLGRGEETGGGRSKPSILADAFEAVIGAVFLDAGWDAARGVVQRLLADRLEQAATGTGQLDDKTALQELAAHAFHGPPAYDLRDEGPDHAKRFFATVLLDGAAWGSGEGRSKKQAEQAAARDARRRLAAAGPAPTPPR